MFEKAVNNPPPAALPIRTDADKATSTASIPISHQMSFNFTVMMLFNARSIVNKVDFLDALLNSENLDFIFIVETWLKPIYNDAYVLGKNNYSMLRSDRVKEKGGGVCVIYKNEFASKINPVEIDNNLCDGFEIIAFDFYSTSFKFSRFICLYLPPVSAKNLTTVNNLIRVVNDLKTKSRLYILGDFNFPNFDRRAFISGNAGKSQQEFKNFTKTHNLAQLISFPTQIHGNTLELFFTSDPKSVVNIEQREPLTTTCDHNMIKIKIDLQQQRKTPIPKRRNFYKGNYKQINVFLSSYNWSNIFRNSTDINFLYSEFISVIHRSIESYVPFYRSYKNSGVPKSIKTLLNLKKVVYKRTKTDPSAKPIYKDLEKIYKQEVYKHNISIQHQVSARTNKKSFYGFVNRKLRSRKKLTSLKK